MAAKTGSSGVATDLKTVLDMKPEQRSKWLQKACGLAEGGALKASQIYDVVSSRKIASGMTDKVGQQMLRTLQKHINIFSEKQQRYLSRESPLAARFAKEEDALPQASPVPRGPVSDDAGARMEEMMARCRGFVREKASTFDERQQKDAEEESRRQEEQEERERAEAAQRAADKEIWQRSLHIWERAQMTSMDERSAQQRAREEANVEVAAPPQAQPSSELGKKRRRSSSSASKGQRRTTKASSAKRSTARRKLSSSSPRKKKRSTSSSSSESGRARRRSRN